MTALALLDGPVVISHCMDSIGCQEAKSYQFGLYESYIRATLKPADVGFPECST
jgi:hypothetical protein